MTREELEHIIRASADAIRRWAKSSRDSNTTTTEN